MSEMTTQIDPGTVRAFCPGCKAWKPFDRHTNKFTGHGWISLSDGPRGFIDCAGSEKKIRSSKRAVYRKAERNWIPVRWNDDAQAWELV